jgi:hypothetical protein
LKSSANKPVTPVKPAGAGSGFAAAAPALGLLGAGAGGRGGGFGEDDEDKTEEAGKKRRRRRRRRAGKRPRRVSERVGEIEGALKGFVNTRSAWASWRRMGEVK